MRAHDGDPGGAGRAGDGGDHRPAGAAQRRRRGRGGLELALWCDLRVAAEGATLGVLNRRFGVPLIDLGTIRLPQAALRNDRLSVLEQWDLPEAEAVANELRRGLATLASGETAAGAASFAAGQGRSGAALPPNPGPETR